MGEGGIWASFWASWERNCTLQWTLWDQVFDTLPLMPMLRREGLPLLVRFHLLLALPNQAVESDRDRRTQDAPFWRSKKHSFSFQFSLTLDQWSRISGTIIHDGSHTMNKETKKMLSLLEKLVQLLDKNVGSSIMVVNLACKWWKGLP